MKRIRSTVGDERAHYRSLNYTQQRRFWQRIQNPCKSHQPRRVNIRTGSIRLYRYYLSEIQSWVVSASPVLRALAAMPPSTAPVGITNCMAKEAP